MVFGCHLGPTEKPICLNSPKTTGAVTIVGLHEPAKLCRLIVLSRDDFIITRKFGLRPPDKIRGIRAFGNLKRSTIHPRGHSTRRQSQSFQHFPESSL